MGLALVIGITPVIGQEKSMVVASTTSTQDSGLFDYILPIFKAKSGIEVKVVAQGTGQALDTGGAEMRTLYLSTQKRTRRSFSPKGTA
jgi:ABC-type tungstate transport system permease subunit